MTKDDIIRMALEAGFNHFEYMAGTAPQIARFAELLEAKIRADEREKQLAALEKLSDESHTIQGASDDYKQGREMGIQLCINKLTRGKK